VATGTTREEPPRAADTGTPRLALEQVTKRFGGQVAVDAVDFDLRAGEVHALVGENGAGKSTLVKIADGYHRPDDGQVKVDGRDVTFHSVRDAERAGIAMIPQELDLFPELTVAENLFVGRPRPRYAWRGLDWAAMRAQARERFEQLGVEIDVGAPVRELSTASRQLVAIARALAGDARVVIMDEPTSSLTDQEAQRLFAIIDDLKGEGVGVVYIRTGSRRSSASPTASRSCATASTWRPALRTTSTPRRSCSSWWDARSRTSSRARAASPATSRSRSRGSPATASSRTSRSPCAGARSWPSPA
jgi:ABC-type branched-subunit amino acid transport system ATPase component